MSPSPGLLAGEPVILPDVPLRIDPAEVRAFQDYKPPPPLPPAEVAARLEAARREIAGLVRPRLAYRTVGVTVAEPHRLTLEGGVRLHIPEIGRHWGCVEAVAVGLATIGEDPETRVRARREAGDELGAALLDSAGSAAAECLAEWANDHLCRLGVAARLGVTNRISPGLAGWDLGEQALLLRLCPAPAIGVRLGADGGLRPAKSISFLVGIGRAARVDHYFVQCRRCWAVACPARRLAAVTTVHRDQPSVPPPGEMAREGETAR